MRYLLLLCIAGIVLALLALWPVARLGAANEKPVGVVSHVKVLSNNIEDVSSMEAWKQSFIKPGMTDAEKAMAVWRSVVKFRQQDAPPNEYLQNEANVHDPIKTFNVYGYGQCCCASSNIESLGRFIGLPARGWVGTQHSFPELFYDNAWHMFDASMITYYLENDMKTVAGVEELAANPEAFINNAHCPTADANGFYPAGTHNLEHSLTVYRRKGNIPASYEYGYSQGYEVNVQLRPGMKLTRNWSNTGLHINMPDGWAPGCLKTPVGAGDMKYAPAYGDLAPGRIGNGTLDYTVPLDATFRAAMLTADNVVAKAEDHQGPAVHVQDPAKPGVLILRIPCSYVYLGGSMHVTGAAPAGAVTVFFSDNNGLDWKQLANLTDAFINDIDLKALVFRRYDYRVKLVLSGKGTGVDALSFTNTFQHSQRPLPALVKGKNTITFSAGAQEGTITIEGGTEINAAKGKQLITSDFHPVLNGANANELRLTGGAGDVTFPIETPGEMTRLRFGCFYRARDAKDGWDMQVSFDGGKTFKTIDRCPGPFVGNCKYVAVTDIPAGTKAAQVRWSGQQVNTACIFDFRIDADYKEPLGGFRPVKVTYVWMEGPTEHRDVHIASKPNEVYAITCAETPVMKSLIVELAP